MVNQQIVEYIKSNVSSGYSLEDVKSKILESGISQADLDEAVKAAGVDSSEVKQPSEEAAEQEQPAQEAAEQQPAMQPPAEKQESTFKWWVIAIPLIVLILMWAIFYFYLRA
jgi:ribosomal protein L12E/L44/L45/RPP1/RPP2